MLFKPKLSLEEAQHIISDAKPEQCFWTHTGRYVRSLHELELALIDMGQEEYNYHATKQKNDFSIWVKDIVGDPFLSKKIERARNPWKAASVIRKRLDEIERHIDSEHEKEHELQEDIFSSKDTIVESVLAIVCVILFAVSVLLAYQLL